MLKSFTIHLNYHLNFQNILEGSVEIISAWFFKICLFRMWHVGLFQNAVTSFAIIDTLNVSYNIKVHKRNVLACFVVANDRMRFI